MSELVSPSAHAEFQYASAEHQSRTAIAGMWLFLATEVLFFGALFYTWLMLRRWHLDGFHKAAGDTELLIGSVNTAIIVTTSFLYAWAVHHAKWGRNRQVMIFSLITGALGIAFIGLKLFEWSKDVDKGEWPGIAFHTVGPDPGGQHLFWLLYYAGTGLHVVHMTVGVFLVGWIAWRAFREEFSAKEYTGVEVVGLYWSFVDIVWLNLYPFIYLFDR